MAEIKSVEQLIVGLEEPQPDEQNPVIFAAPLPQDFLQAVINNNILECADLLQRGVDINCVDDEGNNAFIIAVRARNLELARFLFDNGISISNQNNAGLRALDYAIAKCDIESCKFLVSCDALEIYDKDDLSSVFYAIKNKENKDEDIIKLIEIFTDEKFNITSTKDGVLHECARCNRVELGRYLVTNYYFGENFWQHENNPLQIAAAHKDIDFCKMILSNANKMLIGSPPKRFLIFSKILAQQENIEDKMKQYRVLRESDAYNMKDVASALFMTVYCRREDDVNFFINYLYENDCKKLQEVNQDADSLLHALVNCELPFATTVLLQMGVNAGVKNAKEKTAFLCAVEQKSEKMIGAFAKSGIEVRNIGGELGLIEATKQNNFMMVQRILMFDLDVNFQDELGNTALHYAAKAGSAEIYRSLRDQEADDSLENSEGKTAKEILLEKGIVVEPSTKIKAIAYTPTVAREAKRVCV